MQPSPFVRMTRSGLAAAIMLQALASASAAGGSSPRLLDPAPIGMLKPDGKTLSYRADHAIAMAQYRWMGEQGFPARGYRVQHKDLPFDVPWFWASEDGGAIRRVGDGVFRFTRTSPRRDWYFDTTCHAQAWPLFGCDDGWERQMSAPDLLTIVFDEVRYTRVLPPTEVEDEFPPADEEEAPADDAGDDSQ